MTKQTTDPNYVLEWMLLPYVRNLVLDHVKPEMFEKAWQQDFVRTLALFERDQEVELTLLMTKFQQVNKKAELDQQEKFVINTLYNNHKFRASELKLKAHDAIQWNHELNGYIAEIESFIKEKLIAKQLFDMAEHNDRTKRKQIFTNLAEAANFSITKEDEFQDFSDLNAVLRSKQLDIPPDGKIYKSSFNLINMNATIGGYKYGDLIMVCAKPAGGKTTGLCQEGTALALQGAKVMHVCFGDMSDFDLYCNYLTCFRSYSENPVAKINVYKDPEKYVTAESIKFLNRIRMKAYDADALSVYDILAKLSAFKKTFDFDVCIIDYDANMKPVKDSMYEEGGSQYKALKAFASSHRVIQFIGSQIKPDFWDSELIPLTAANESSKKQQNVDYMIGFGWNKKCPFLGMANLGKIRRGVYGPASRLHLDGTYARLREITGKSYDELLNAHVNGTVEVNTSKEDSGKPKGPISL